jgi:serine/threonine-protein kinase
MASVWRADDTLLRREVAVKLPFPHLLRQPDTRARFLREARAAAALDHPGILRIFDIGAEDPPFIVMELLRGRSLRAFLDENGAPLGEMVAMIGGALASAVAVAHGAGIVHRDLKPANVMVCEGGRLVICDFGLARVDDDALATQSGELLGTPAFMPPEQALGRRADARSDIYSLGATLYQLATGVPPYRGSAAAVVQQVIRGQYDAPQRRNPAIGNELAAVIARAMAHAPEARFASAAALGAALDAIAAEAGWPDRAAELAAYFADPGGWNRRATPRILDATLVRARAAADSGKVARALALAERALAIDPTHTEANTLVARLGVGARRRREATLLLVGACALAVGALGVMALRGRGRGSDASSPSAARTDMSVPGRDAGLSRTDMSVLTRDGGLPRTDMSVLSRDGGTARTGMSVLAPVARDAGVRATAGPGAASDAGARSARIAVSAQVPDAGPHRHPRPTGPAAPATVGETAPLPDARPAAAPAPATVTVKILPWCDITVDTNAHGRSPFASSISLAPGHHTLVCSQPGVAGGRATVELDLAPGEHRVVERHLYGLVSVRMAIRRGPVRIDGRSVAAGATLELDPGRHEVEVQGETPSFVSIPTHACELRDVPELACYEAK